ncbi:hypothetical protein C1646_820849 [Rhizophagus diaphanus]|nr:hypothetical protein C1646_820849 [Rhizophagus diaphanus] [Rhizophagus sp. MUCL 43196]
MDCIELPSDIGRILPKIAIGNEVFTLIPISSSISSSSSPITAATATTAATALKMTPALFSISICLLIYSQLQIKSITSLQPEFVT